jgi:hypothetical protein
MKRKGPKDIALNIKLPEALIRVGLGLALPTLLIWFHTLPFILIICALSGYLLITGMLFFCFIKYLFQHLLTGKTRLTPEEKSNPLKDL